MTYDMYMIHPTQLKTTEKQIGFNKHTTTVNSIPCDAGTREHSHACREKIELEVAFDIDLDVSSDTDVNFQT